MKKIHLSIPKPCHEDWGAMTPSDKGRFCGSCQKTVVDFTIMSDRQLAEFFKKPPSSVCGRVYDDQLNRDIIIPKKRIPWVKYFFQFSLPAFLISMKASAQKGNPVVKDSSFYNQALGLVAAQPFVEKTETDTIRGEVVDASTAKIVGATVMIKGTNAGTITDANGSFELEAKPGSILVISSVGYTTKEVIAVSSFKMTAVLDPVMMGFVVVGTIRKKSKSVPLIQKLIDTTFKKFSVYPNPVQKNSFINIDFKKLGPGRYTVSIINVAGQVVQLEEINLEAKRQVIKIRLRDMVAGTHVIQILDKEKQTFYSEKIIVQ